MLGAQLAARLAEKLGSLGIQSVSCLFFWLLFFLFLSRLDFCCGRKDRGARAGLCVGLGFSLCVWRSQLGLRMSALALAWYDLWISSLAGFSQRGEGHDGVEHQDRGGGFAVLGLNQECLRFVCLADAGACHHQRRLI